MFEDNVLESRPHALEEVESPQTVPAVGRAPNAKSLNQEVEARAPVRQEDPGEWIEWPAQPEEEQPQATSKKSRTSLLKRRLWSTPSERCFSPRSWAAATFI